MAKPFDVLSLNPSNYRTATTFAIGTPGIRPQAQGCSSDVYLGSAALAVDALKPTYSRERLALAALERRVPKQEAGSVLLPS